MATRLLLLAVLQHLDPARAAYVRVGEVDASAGCPTAFDFHSGPGVDVCTRSAMVSSVSFDVASILGSNADPHGVGRYTHINGTMRAYQFYYTKGFCVGSAQNGICTSARDTTSVESDNYVDGVSVTMGDPGSRVHVHTLAVASSSVPADPALTGGPALRDDLCPCGGATTVCSSNGASSAPSFVGTDFTCLSGYDGDFIPERIWHPEPLDVNFSVTMSQTGADVEVRLMSSQSGLFSGVVFQDVGIEYLAIDVFEIDDYTPPVLTLIGDPTVSVEVYFETFSDPGATCTDDVDGTLDVNVTGEVNALITGLYVVTYSCEDGQANLASASRQVIVYDFEAPVVAVYGDDQCIEEGDPYIEQGASCVDRYEGTRPVSIEHSMDTSSPGTYIVNYSCSDFSGNTAETSRTVKVMPDTPPGGLHLSFVGLDSGGQQVQAGYGSILSNVDPATNFRLQWSGPVFLGPGECRFFSVAEESAATPSVFEGNSFSSSLTVSGDILLLSQDAAHGRWADLKDMTTYTVTVGESFALDQNGAGTLRQEFSFVTGDYTGPSVQASAPSYGHLDWPADSAIHLIFSEKVHAGSGGSVRLWRANDSTWEEAFCNESIGDALSLQGSTAVISMSAFEAWAPCAEMRLSVDGACFSDTSVNANPAEDLHDLRFVTSCVVAMDPPDGSLDVPILSPVVLQFADTIQMGSGNVSLAMLGGETKTVSAADFPLVRADDKELVVDLGCQTEFCSSHGLSRYIDASQGLCTGREPQRCKGLTLQVSLDVGAVLFASQVWPQDTLLANYTDALPPQLNGAYEFVLKPADLSGPVVVSIAAAATSAHAVRVTARLTEGGQVHCAALGDFNTVPCSLNISNDMSAGACTGATYGCYNRHTMWVDGGCFGVFTFEGEEIACGSGDVANASCALSTAPSWARITGTDARRDAGASAKALLHAAAGYAEATLMLEGLAESQSYEIYCAARDAEEPLGNAMDSQGVLGFGQSITTLDQTPPRVTSFVSLNATLTRVAVAVTLSEPGVAYCLHGETWAKAPSREEVVAFGSSYGTAANYTAVVSVSGMLPDRDYIIHCTARDLAGGHPDAGARGDNWAVDLAILYVATREDAQPPSLLSIVPARDSYAECQPDSPEEMCRVRMTMVFDEDIFFGPGRVYLECTRFNFPVACTEGDQWDLDTSNSEVVNHELHVVTPAIALQSVYKLVVVDGGLQDADGNAFEMDTACFPSGTVYGCEITYFFKTET